MPKSPPVLWRTHQRTHHPTSREPMFVQKHPTRGTRLIPLSRQETDTSRCTNGLCPGEDCACICHTRDGQ